MPTQRARNLETEIRDRLRCDEAARVEFAADLIRIGSENPPGVEYAACADRIASSLRELGLQVSTANLSGSGLCVIGTFGEGRRALYFSGHYDVVPAQERSQFEPVVRGGNLFGRGAADMKGRIAAMAFAIRALAAAGFDPKRRILSVSVPDEETSGPKGPVALIEAGLVESDAMRSGSSSAPACSRPATTPPSGSRRSPTVPASSRSPTGPTSSTRSRGCSNAPRSTPSKPCACSRRIHVVADPRTVPERPLGKLESLG